METQERRKTAGEIAYEGRTKPIDIISPYESAENALKYYFKGVEECINNHKNRAIFRDRDFYVCVLIKKEKLLSAITPTIRHYFVGLLACPAPNFDQNVYKYHRKLHAIEELWMMPDPDTCKYLIRNKHNINKHEGRLLEYYNRFASGDLWRVMKEENNEEADNPQLKRKES